ncbi:FRG domain-containing protein [Agrobacterium bohemicum]|uniref:FRG domain-containing protein n=1 Tax=Agrobacterium bohemicum TaxID=2052828 RepID=A0A135P315_9HYPH|nr:FRG domain-containing protein [Agrobacterium bohemicum]KXG85788.1 hypothetical protein ATO67_03895 [Agrobacterium bohemicum]
MISRFNEYIQYIESFRSKAPPGVELWYRGHSSTSYKLEPYIHRNRVAEHRTEIEGMEKSVYDEFLRRSPLFDTYKRDQWDLLFLMQHYRAPTRLLDWTASPLVALFFALMSGNDANNAIVWCLNPSAWNGIVLDDIKEPPRIFATDESIIKQYHPTFNEKSSRSEPLAIQGIMNNPRINAQKGRFVIFGSEPKDQKTYAQQYKVKNDVLRQAVIDKNAKSKILSDLESYGITYSTIFPDLEGLAIEIRRRHGRSNV